MTKIGSSASVWDSVKVGQVFPSFDYVVSQEMLDEYRLITDNPRAAYPTVAGRHALRAWTNFYGPGKLMNVGAESEYLNPVVPGKRIRVEAAIVEKYMRRNKPYIIVDSTATDEDGRVIEKSRLIGMAAPAEKPLFSEVSGKWEK